LKGLGDAYNGVSEIERDHVSWKKKNAQVLHIIQISCGRYIQDELSHYKTARLAWNHLLVRYGKISNEKVDDLQEGNFLKCNCCVFVSSYLYTFFFRISIK
jgi:hypothetical protein